MGQLRILALVRRHPHPANLARTAPGDATFTALQQLESHGLITRRHGLYRLTRQGRSELDMSQAIAGLLRPTQARVSSI